VTTAETQAQPTTTLTLSTVVPKAKGRTPTAVQAKKTVVQTAAEIVAQVFPKKAAQKRASVIESSDSDLEQDDDEGSSSEESKPG